MLAYKLAVRFLKAGRGQTILIITGISIAVAAQIFVGLLINSLQLTLVDRTVGNQPQITITSDGGMIDNWEQVVAEVATADMVETVSATATGALFYNTDPMILKGIDDLNTTVYGLTDNLYEGVLPEAEDEVLVGKDFVEKYSLSPGDEIDLDQPGGGSSRFTVSGVFDFGVQQLNESWVITNLSVVQGLFGYQDTIRSIEIGVSDYFLADTIAADIQTQLGDSLSVSNWKVENEQLLSGLQGQSISSLMIQIFIIVSVVIAISAILAITVFQKSRQIGILKAMGIKDRSASLIFIFEGLIIGVIGSVIGVALGMLLLYGFSFGTSQPDAPALIDLYIDPGFIVLSWGIAVLASVIAAVIPARRSLRLNPIDVIREG